MSIERSDSQQTTCSAIATIDGDRRMVASATCSIRPGRGIDFSVYLADHATVAEDEMAQIASMFASYLAEEIEKAAALGVPLTLPAQ